MRIYEICESCFKFNNTYHDDDNMICDNRFHTVVNDIHIFIYRNHSKTYDFKVAFVPVFMHIYSLVVSFGK